MYAYLRCGETAQQDEIAGYLIVGQHERHRYCIQIPSNRWRVENWGKVAVDVLLLCSKLLDLVFRSQALLPRLQLMLYKASLFASSDAIIVVGEHSEEDINRSTYSSGSTGIQRVL